MRPTRERALHLILMAWEKLSLLAAELIRNQSIVVVAVVVARSQVDTIFHRWPPTSPDLVRRHSPCPSRTPTIGNVAERCTKSEAPRDQRRSEARHDPIRPRDHDKDAGRKRASVALWHYARPAFVRSPLDMTDVHVRREFQRSCTQARRTRPSEDSTPPRRSFVRRSETRPHDATALPMSLATGGHGCAPMHRSLTAGLKGLERMTGSERRGRTERAIGLGPVCHTYAPRWA